jgi:hypothetical protein
METLKKIVSNQYFPAAAVLTVVVLFWTIAMFGGLSLLHNNQPPMATLTWMLFVYCAAVLTPLAGIIAAADLVRRWRRNRQYAQEELAQAEYASFLSADEPVQDDSVLDAPSQDDPVLNEPVTDKLDGQLPAPEAPRQSAPAEPAQQRPAAHQPAKKQPGQTKQRKTAA